MLLVFTSNELERLAGKFSPKKLDIEFLGSNQFKVKTSGVSIKFLVEEVEPRKLILSYKMNAIINFFAEGFIKLDKPGVIWEKDLDRIHLDFDQLSQDENLKDFFLRQLIIDDQKMIIEFDLRVELPENFT